jgi:hypothetical protein
LLEDLGRRVGALAGALATFDHPAIHRDFHWDLARAPRRRRRARAARRVAAARRDRRGRGALDAETAPLLPRLRRAAVHGDLNDHNVLVAGDRVTGIVDFGDMVHGWAVADLAIAAAYVALGADDVLTAVASLVRGHHAARPLHEAEIAALPGLIAMRLCARRVPRRDPAPAPAGRRVPRREPGRDPAPASRARADPDRARDRCLPRRVRARAVPSSARVRAWLGARAADFAPVLDVDLRTAPCVVLDLSVGSPLVSGDARENAEPLLTRRVAEFVTASVERGAWGGGRDAIAPRSTLHAPRLALSRSAAGTSRVCSTSRRSSRSHRRAPHRARRLDLFADAGTPVHAPLDGTVHAFADNRTEQDYGPVIVLRHETDAGDAFYTLYGHLSRASLDGLAVGRRVARGERFASLGTPRRTSAGRRTCTCR